MTKMRMSVSQLRQIIKEEVECAMNEADNEVAPAPADMEKVANAADLLKKFKESLAGTSMSSDSLTRLWGAMKPMLDKAKEGGKLGSSQLSNIQKTVSKIKGTAKKSTET